ncbi:MAG: hypothetical protein AB4911_22770 [Oscillochloridaceae bacterium umkhey_bin13]
MTVQSNQTGETYRPPAFPLETILPHHRWLAQRAAEQARAGRGMLVFAEHTNKLDVLADLQTKIQQLALRDHGTPVKVAILRSTTVKPDARGAWFAEREQDGTNTGAVEGQVAGEGGQIALNVKYLGEALAVIGTPQVALEMVTAQAPGVLRPVGQNGYVHVIMPMALR